MLDETAQRIYRDSLITSEDIDITLPTGAEVKARMIDKYTTTRIKTWLDNAWSAAVGAVLWVIIKITGRDGV